MICKISVEVNTREDATAIEAALRQAEPRAYCIVVGSLLPLSERERLRVMNYVVDVLDERNEAAAKGGGT